METQQITLDPQEARALYRKYREHVHWSQPIDDEIRRTYHAIAQGKVVIKALESVAGAGVGDDGLPKLAICRADAQTCFLEYNPDGSVAMACQQRVYSRDHKRLYFQWPADTFPRRDQLRPVERYVRRQALVPLVPVHLRPRRGMANYHLLWEAIWHPAPPTDPMLLRRIGEGDIWVVLAAWDLTPVEQAALAARL